MIQFSDYVNKYSNTTLGEGTFEDLLDWSVAIFQSWNVNTNLNSVCLNKALLQQVRYLEQNPNVLNTDNGQYKSFSVTNFSATYADDYDSSKSYGSPLAYMTLENCGLINSFATMGVDNCCGCDSYNSNDDVVDNMFSGMFKYPIEFNKYYLIDISMLDELEALMIGFDINMRQDQLHESYKHVQFGIAKQSGPLTYSIYQPTDEPMMVQPDIPYWINSFVMLPDTYVEIQNSQHNLMAIRIRLYNYLFDEFPIVGNVDFYCSKRIVYLDEEQD